MTERRLALIDDHTLFSEAFRTLLKQLRPGYVIDVYDDPTAFLKAFDPSAPYDLVILDLVMQKMNGLALLSSLTGLSPNVRVLMLSGVGTEPPVAEMRRLGARGFVHKSEETHVLLEAVDTILSGNTCFPAAIAEPDDDAVFRELCRGANAGMPSLGPRQLEVLQLIASGETNRGIADRLGISENTVKSHLKAIFEALGENNRTACVRSAQNLGLIS